jgi:outer membrane protein TolC
LAPLPASEQLQTWWQGFEDPTLDGLVRTALRDNLDLAGAVERLQAARVIRQHASARYLPYVRAKTEDVINPNASAAYLVAGFDAVWELGLFGRREGTRRLTQGALDEAGASLAGARVSLVGEVVGDYLMAAAMQDRLRILHEQEGVLRRQGELIRVRVQLGLATAQHAGILHEVFEVNEPISVRVKKVGVGPSEVAGGGGGRRLVPALAVARRVRHRDQAVIQAHQ